MLKKLEKRIRLLLLIPMILLIVLIGASFIYMNYDSVLSGAKGTINRYATVLNDQPQRTEDNQQEIGSPEEQPGFTPKGADTPRNSGARSESYGSLYEFVVNHNEITYQTIDDEKIVSTALSLAHGNEHDGIKNGFFYRVQKTGQSSYNIKLLEDTELYWRFLSSVLTTAVIVVIGILLWIFISFTISKIIIRPIAENEERQKRFISDTSHELKTPLSVIAVNADMQEAETGKTKWLTYIQSEVESMEKLISRLLLLSSSERNDEESYSEFDLSSQAELCVSRFEALAYDEGVSVISAISPNISFFGNPDDIEHIISPLMDNAIKHTPKGGKVFLTLMTERNDVLLRVQNEGSPIPDEDIDRIFDRFYRVDKARNREEKRFGLGLPIVKAEVEKYNGKIEVQCGNGLTTFTVKLKMR